MINKVTPEQRKEIKEAIEKWFAYLKQTQG